KSTLNHLMCIPLTDVAQVANAARNYEILYERDDDGAERLDKSHRNHSHNNDRHGSDRQGGGNNHRSNNNYSGNNNSPGVPLRATPSRFALNVDADTLESVIELLVPASSVV
nr:hypothetical protein [Tanacetum cinerariifolium]